jgi:hypothetical protein
VFAAERKLSGHGLVVLGEWMLLSFSDYVSEKEENVTLLFYIMELLAINEKYLHCN